MYGSRWSESTLVIPKFKNVKAKNLRLGDKLVNEIFDKRGRLVYTQPDVKKVTIWGKEYLAVLYNVTNKGDWFCYAYVVTVGKNKIPYYGMGRNKRRALSSLIRILEHHAFKKYATRLQD